MKNLIFNFFLVLLITSCHKEKIDISTNAHDIFFLKEQGVSIPIQVHGNTLSKKILVVVTGGPGSSSLTYRNKNVINGIEKDIAIAYYDQRFAGASQGSNPSTDVALYKSDLKKVIILLKARYGSDVSLYVMGHSWGGFLTPYFLIENNNQNLVKGWIQVDGAHNYFRSDSLTKAKLLYRGAQEIQAMRNTTFWQEAINYCNAHEYNESYEVSLKLNEYAFGAETNSSEVTVTATPIAILLDPTIINKLPLTAHLINISISNSKEIDRQVYNIPISENLHKIKIPTLLLWGKHDFVCPTGLINDIETNIGSTDLSKKIFENSGHSPMFNEPDAFWQTMNTWIKLH